MRGRQRKRAPIEPGATFEGRYEILAELGEGGFGSVYKARQRATGQLVALKIMRLPEQGAAARADTRAARFLREARLCAQLHHPNIVRVIESGQAGDGSLYTVFAFVPGDNLADVLAREGALAPREARHLMLQVLDALACAHAAGVVHRDLKPANVMVIPTGARRNALVLDFGIGAVIADVTRGTGPEGGHPHGEAPPRLTGSNDTLGTPGYGAPEQWCGGEPSARADLFAWGLVFLECLTGRPVYGGTPAEIFYQLLGADPVPIPAALARHPVGELLAQAMRKDVAARDVTAAGLLEALDACDLRGLSREAVLGAPAAAPAGLLFVEGGLTQTAEPPPAGERRQVTALCCHLSALAAEGGAPDLEELDDAARASLAIAAGVARRHGGSVVAALGGELLVYFGYPRAEEDDVQRAGRTALAIAGAVQAESDRRAPRGVRVEVGVGVHTGMVLAGDARGADLEVGATPWLAARLAWLAAPGSAVVTAESQRLLRGSFELDAAGAPPARGAAAPIETFLLGRERAARSAGTTMDGARGPLVGREQEIGPLLERWRRVQGGAGQCSLVTGEPGIGKSRLARELRDRLPLEGHTFLEGRCAPHTQNSALFPIVEMLAAALELDQDPAIPGKIAGLEASLACHGLAPAEVMPILLPLFSLPVADPYAPLALSPQEQKARTFDTIVSLLFAVAEARPLLLLVEDLHWADPTTIELLTQLVREAPAEPVYVLMTARPEFSPSFSTTGMLQLHLARLERPEIEAMIAELAGHKALPAAVLEQVVARTDGVPLFVEELTQMMMESGALVEQADGYALAKPLSDAELPGTLRALLTVRLDRLGRAKETAQLAAALGREVDVDLLAAASPLGAAAVQEDLDRLTAAGIMLRRRRGKGATCLFKHALVRDAAYESMGRAARRGAHARIAAVVEERFPGLAAAQPDLLAHHHAAADQRREAVGYARKAVQQAMDRSAYVEAVRRGKEAIGWLGAVEDVEEREELELGVGSQMTLALLAQASSRGEELAQVAERTLELVDRRGDRADTGPMLWRLLLYYLHVSPQKAREVAERLLALAEKTKDVGQEAALLAILGNCLWIAARFEEARARFERCLAIYDPDRHRDSALQYGIDTKVCALSGLASVTWYVGYPDRALGYAQDAVKWSKEIGHALSMNNALLSLAGVHQARMEREEVAWASGIVLKDVGRYGRGMEAYHGIFHAWANRDLDEARRHLATLHASGERASMTIWIAVVAEVEASRGDYAAALLHIEESERLVAETGEDYGLSDILRLKGSFLMARGEAAAAEPCLREAIALAHGRGARYLELRAATTLGRLLRDQGRGEEARATVAPILAWFTEGHELEVMLEAQRLIAMKNG